jgi:hypothetical protein
MTHKLENVGRRLTNLHNRSVKEVLPEHFTSDYPNLVQFLEYYYDFLDSDGGSAFETEINQLFSIRDITETPSEYLDQVIAELGAGLQNGDLFNNPRFTSRRFADHYRNKGSRFAVEEFFRAFFQQEVEVLYPKVDIFTVGRDAIGYDSQKFIQDYKRYQIFSILLKVGLGVPTYRELYKKFAHPAGFYFEGIVAVEGEANLGFDDMPIALADSAFISLIGEANIDISLLSSTTGLTDSEGVGIRYNIDQLANLYSTLTAQQINNYYSSIAEFISPNSFTMDDSADSNTPLMSLSLETMDNNMFTRYASDSAY